jgi:hypothetical protein
MIAARQKLLTADEQTKWSEAVFQPLQKDLTSRWPMAMATLADYYAAVSEGLVR